MVEPFLSVCIPTYNYGRYIAEALDSVTSQMPPIVEVVVLDGGSIDDTGDTVAHRAAAQPAIKYFRQDKPGGIDRDMARSIELATGKFCWLLSADDALVPGALGRIIEEFGRGYGVLLANRIWCDAELHAVRPESWLEDADRDIEVDFEHSVQVKAYLNHARSLGAVFSFMSCIGFRREDWLRTPVDESLVGSNYAHVYRLFEMIRAKALFKYIAAPLVRCRGGADSFRAGGLASRLNIDLKGYRALGRVLFPEDAALQRSFREVVKREHPWWRWVRARAETSDAAVWAELEHQLAEYDFGRMALGAIRVLGDISAPILRAAAHAKRV